MSSSTSEKRCGVLGATGAVGQRFILLLHQHPFLRLQAVAASPGSKGRRYRDAVRWKQSEPLPEESAELILRSCSAGEFLDCDIVFSGLGSDIAGEIETSFQQANIAVFSNAKNHRRDEFVPLVVPTVNPSHLNLIPHQRRLLNGGGKGSLVCNSNCAVIGVVIPFAALQAAFGPIAHASVVTLQAVSGAGYPGVSSMDMVDNVVPYIAGEEDKLETEAQKILGSIAADAQSLTPLAKMRVSATCTRVPVLDGHTACVSLRFERLPPPSLEDCVKALREYRLPEDIRQLQCPSAPDRPIIVRDEPDRPQPRLDRGAAGGYAVSVGRVRGDAVDGMWHLRFVALSHNSKF